MVTGGLVGANPDQLDELAARMNSGADTLEAVRQAIFLSLRRTEWPGPDGDQFRHDWDHRHARVIATAVTALREAARVLRVNAAEQRGASLDGSGLVPPALFGMVRSALDQVRGFLGAGLASIGYSRGTPSENFAWWSGLTPERRAELIHEYPGLVGSMDGIPAADRDAANRIRLERAVADLPAQVAQLREQLANGQITQEQFNQRALQLAAIRHLHDRLARGEDLYLLGFDPSGEGRAIVAVGNPDTADHVATFVPGMDTTLASVNGHVSNMAALRDMAQSLAPNESTSAILWFDYDAPNGLMEAARATHAEAASENLDGFLDGLRASHVGEPSHNTIIGHSYGGKVVGIADREETLAVDDMIFIGNPDIGVNHASELSVGAGHVYASVAPGDPIELVNIPLVTPAEEGFGSQQFTSHRTEVPDAHSSYFRQNSPAMFNQAAIITGHGEFVY